MAKKSPIRIWLFYLFTDLLAVVGAYYTTLVIRLHSALGKQFFDTLNRLLGIMEPGDLGRRMVLFYDQSAPRLILILSVTLCFLYAFLNLYAGRQFIRKRPVAWNVIMANAVALGLFYCYFYARWNVFHPRTIFATIMFFNVVYCIGLRSLLYRVLQFARTRFHVDEFLAVLVGSGDEADLLNEFITTVRPHGIQVADRIRVDSGWNNEKLLEAIADSVAKHDAHMIICADTRLELAQIMSIVTLSEKLGVCAKVLSGKLDVLITQARQPLDIIRGVPLVHFEVLSESKAWSGLRRAICVVISCLALVVLAPFLALIALVVRLTSAGSAIFVQERIGVDRKPFRMYKFRTMHHLADELQAQVEEYNEAGLGLFKIRKDPRMTLAGRFLRRFSLDELPQLVNVLRGEMLIVGPRPLPRRDFENYYEDWHYSRHSILPGLTGLWQVSGRSDVDFRNMCILDIYYLRNRGMMLDLKIILKTFWVVLFAKGAY